MASLGAELRRLWDRPLSVSRPAKGWHAQISALTKSSRGYEAAAKVGLHVKQERTLKNWLSQTTEPRSRDKALINAAYRYMVGAWDPSVQNRTYSITGDIDSGDRTQDRELIIDGSSGDWQPIIDAYLNGASDQELEDLFIEHVIVEDIGESSPRPGSDNEYGWGFPGNNYEILL